MNSKHQTVEPITRQEFIEVTNDNGTTEVCEALVRAVYFIDDYDWLIEKLNQFLDHPNDNIKSVTVTCYGHLARLHKTANKNELLTILQPLLANQKLSGYAEDAIDDIEMFCP